MKITAFALAACVLPMSAPCSSRSVADDIARYESGGEMEADPSEVPVEAPRDMKLILCIGQSNMAGRAKMEEGDGEVVEGAYARSAKWGVAQCHAKWYHIPEVNTRERSLCEHEQRKNRCRGADA
nr:sialate O-acetylesterase [Kiritimatiellia bacterium]